MTVLITHSPNLKDATNYAFLFQCSMFMGVGLQCIYIWAGTSIGIFQPVSTTFYSHISSSVPRLQLDNWTKII